MEGTLVGGCCGGEVAPVYLSPTSAHNQEVVDLRCRGADSQHKDATQPWIILHRDL